MFGRGLYGPYGGYGGIGYSPFTPYGYGGVGYGFGGVCGPGYGSFCRRRGQGYGYPGYNTGFNPFLPYNYF